MLFYFLYKIDYFLAFLSNNEEKSFILYGANIYFVLIIREGEHYDIIY